jgi:TolA-binding protein
VGSVIVRGPLSESGIALRAGQRLVADVQARKLRIEEIAAPQPVASAEVSGAPAGGDRTAPATLDPGATPVPNDESAVAPPEEIAADDSVVRGPLGRADSPSAREATPKPAELSWSARVAAGDFASVLSEAEESGIDATLTRATARDLVALSDAARYKGKAELARRTLGAIRTRFPTSVDAKNALFQLGRLAEGRGALTEALAHYDRYLEGSRNGAFAAEAFGRKLIVTRKAAGDETARSVARDYLARFPSGPYAGTARELLGSR